jgi:serine/threonine protein kinase
LEQFNEETAQIRAGVISTRQVITKIADFGLSSQCSLPYAVRVVDNPLWLAPEILQDKPYTKKSDVYSFAIIFNELFTCQTPFDEYTYTFLSQLEERVSFIFYFISYIFDDVSNFFLIKICTENLRPTIPDCCPESCEELIMQCWAPDPNNRPHFTDIVDKLIQIAVDNRFQMDHTTCTSDDTTVSEDVSSIATDTSCQTDKAGWQDLEEDISPEDLDDFSEDEPEPDYY